MFILPLFSLAKIGTIQNSSSVEWIDKLWYVHSKDYSIAVKMIEPSVCTSTWTDHLERSREQDRQVTEQNIQYDYNLDVKTYIGGKQKKRKRKYQINARYGYH